MASPLMMMHFVLETLAKELPPRIPEPEMLMLTPVQVEAYAGEGQGHGFLAPLHLYHAIQASAFIRPGDQVLDLACGPGNQLLQIARMNPEARFVGVDASAQMLAQARRLASQVGNLDFRSGLLPQLTGIEDASFDTVLCTMALHHLPDVGAVEQTFAEIRRVLKPEGRFFVIDFGRLKRIGTQRYLANQRLRGWPEVFRIDYFNSLRAAFSLDELACSGRAVFGEQVLARQTHQVPLFIALLSPGARALTHAQQAVARQVFLGFAGRQRADFRDVARFFAQGGYPLSFEPWASA